MIIDYNSLLIAVGAATGAAGFTFLITALSDQTDRFLATCGIALLLIVASVGLFVVFSTSNQLWAGVDACAILLVALNFAVAAACQFRDEPVPAGKLIGQTMAMMALIYTPYALGLGGLTFVFANAAAAYLLATNAYLYWHNSKENPATIKALSALYLLVALSFVSCTIMLIIESPFILLQPPSNWAETANLAISVIAVTGIGTLSITLNHQRLARNLINVAQTDPRTGLLNNRGLQDRFSENGLPANASIILVDLDRFIAITNIQGHSSGHRLLCIFAEICQKKLRDTDVAFRLGDDDFCVILPDTNPATAISLADAIRIAFDRQTFAEGGDQLSCTLSIGLYTNISGTAQKLDSAMQIADRALNRAKGDGRDLVRCAKHPRAA